MSKEGAVVLTLEELGNALLDGIDAAAGAVGTHGAAVLEQELGSLNDVRLVAQAVDQHILLVEQLRVLQQAQDLAEEGDGLLVQLLRVANVGRDDMVKGQAGVALAQLGAQLFRLDGQLAADGVFGGTDVRVDVVDVEPAHFVGGGCECAGRVDEPGSVPETETATEIIGIGLVGWLKPCRWRGRKCDEGSPKTGSF
ncbi:hypothetical protein MKX07_007404 [Trichoderma sp. CBMAI-0711]|nr:hypothetical protein MKX07_007404 [Trichoderma sp. CBMAI-0711]